MSSFIPIRYMTGDATQPSHAGPAIIAHVCNDIGGWGAGFVRAISKRWKEPEQNYRRWSNGTDPDCPPFALGEVQFVRVTEHLLIANMIGQHGIRRGSGPPPVRYEAIDQSLKKVGDEALQVASSVHMPRIGCGLAGGTWDRIEPLLFTRLSSRGISVTVYDFARP